MILCHLSLLKHSRNTAGLLSIAFSLSYHPLELDCLVGSPSPKGRGTHYSHFYHHFSKTKPHGESKYLTRDKSLGLVSPQVLACKKQGLDPIGPAAGMRFWDVERDTESPQAHGTIQHGAIIADAWCNPCWSRMKERRKWAYRPAG